MASGFNVVDYMSLTSAERCVVRLIMRTMTMTYSQLRLAAAEQHVDQNRLDQALNHLTHMRWIIPQMNGSQVVYRVNAMSRTSSNSGGFLSDLDLDSIPMPESLNFQPDPSNSALPMKSGGKRVLPQQIWDCLCDTPENNSAQAPAHAYKSRRQNNLYDKLIGDDKSL